MIVIAFIDSRDLHSAGRLESRERPRGAEIARRPAGGRDGQSVGSVENAGARRLQLWLDWLASAEATHRRRLELLREPCTSALPAPMAQPGSAVLRIGVLALRDDNGGGVSAGWWAQLCVAGQAGEEVVVDGRRAAFNVNSRQCAVDVHVYRGEIGVHALVGVARISLAELGLSTVGSSWRTTWVALHRRWRCTGHCGWQLQLCAVLLVQQSAEPPASAIQVHRCFEAMVCDRQQVSWSQERDEARRELIELVRCGGIPAARRAQAWLSVSGARHKKHAAEVDTYAQWLAWLRSGGWREDDALSTQLHTIKKDLPRTFPDDNIYANTVQGKRILECVLGAACLHNRQSNPSGGYCQGLNSVAACLLTYLNDVDTFWMLEHIQESLCVGYYTDTMVMVNVDVAVVDDIVREMLPGAHAALCAIEESDFFNPMHVHVPKWLIPLFATELPSNTLFRLWDIVFTEGSHVLVCASAAVVELISDELEALAPPQAATSSSRSQSTSADVCTHSSDQRVEQVQALFRLGTSLAFCDTEKFVSATVRFLELYSSEKIDQMRAGHYAKFASSGTVQRGSISSTAQRSRASNSGAPADATVPIVAANSGDGPGNSAGSWNKTSPTLPSTPDCAVVGAAPTGRRDLIRTRDDPGFCADSTNATTQAHGPNVAVSRRQMERHITAARRAARHASDTAVAAQAEAAARARSVSQARVALATACEKTISCKRERERAEEQAAAAELRVGTMVAEVHRLRTMLLEKKHHHFLARQRTTDHQRDHQRDKQPVTGGSAAGETIVSQPFDSCLVQMANRGDETDADSTFRLPQPLPSAAATPAGQSVSSGVDAAQCDPAITAEAVRFSLSLSCSLALSLFLMMVSLPASLLPSLPLSRWFQPAMSIKALHNLVTQHWKKQQ